jgi:hypothetical protein
MQSRELGAAANEISIACEADRALAESWRVLHRCVLEPTGTEPTVLQLAEASLRLEWSDEAQLMAALDMIESGAPLSAIELLKRLLTVPASKSIEVCVWNNLGLAYKYLNRLPLAHECYVSACTVGVERIEPWLNRLVRGLQLGHISDVRDTSLVVEEMAPSAPHRLDLFVKANLRERMQGIWSPTKASQESLEAIRLVAGPAVRRILNVFE